MVQRTNLLTEKKEKTPYFYIFLAALLICIIPTFLIATLASFLFGWPINLEAFLWPIGGIVFVFFVQWIIGLIENHQRLRARISQLEKDNY